MRSDEELFAFLDSRFRGNDVNHARRPFRHSRESGNPSPDSGFDSPRYLRYEFNDKVDGQGLELFCFPFDVVRPDESIREIMRRLAGR